VPGTGQRPNGHAHIGHAPCLELVSECSLEAAADDQAAGELAEGEVELGASFPAGGDAPVVVEPGVGAFDRPPFACLWVALAALAGAAAAHDVWLDPAAAQALAQMLGVIAAVGQERVGPVGVSGTQGRQRVDKREQVAALVFVCAAQAERERNTAGVTGEMQLGGRPAPVCRAFPDPGAPLFAGTIVASTSARSQPIASASPSRACSRSTSRSHTPARCHSSSRRQHVLPDGRPGSCGNARQGIPQRNTNRIPSKHARSS